ncbi:MAG: autotransporter-associated beta strand repeat-containing protein [Akkermansiaceae bacterium]|nr:autotransporter-associated beta strand repeat-containing protein [Akkermansiaceae bacterium]
MKPNSKLAMLRNSSFGAPLVTAIVLCFSASLSHGAENNWTGTTSSDWNVATNWSEGGVPDQSFDDNAVVATVSPNIATITANISSTPKDIIVRGGGQLDHTAGTAGTGGGAWMFVGQNDTAGTYNLANTGSAGAGITGFAQGTGSLNATGNLLVGAYGDNRTGTVRVNTSGTLAVSGELFIGDSQNSTANFLLESGTMTANNKIFVGNNKANGTLTMSGGTLTKTGGDETFVGRDQGTGTITQSGGTLTLNHNLYVGQSSGSTGTYNISGSSVLNVARDFVVGRESGTGTLNMTGGTITKTGDEKFIVGHNNGVGTVVQSGGTISANNELYIGNENASASGTYTLSGTGALNISNEVVVGRESGTGVLNVNGGTLTTSGNGNMYIGRRNGTGTLNQSAGTISVNKEFGVGTRDDNKIGTGTYNLSGGLLTASNNIFIGKEEGASGTMTMTGGTMTGSDKLIIGHNRASGSLSHSAGTVNVQNEVYIGNENSASSVGTYTLSGSAVLNVGNEVQVGRDNGTGTFNLNGGTVNASKISGGNGSATVNFNGGVLKAKRDESNLIENLDVANVQSSGIKIDSNGFNVSTSQVLTGTGGLEKSGAGQLTLSGANIYAGTTTVTAGALRIEKAGLNAIIDFAANTLVAEFTSTPTAGTYPILPGSLAGAQTFSATGLGVNQLATFSNATSTVTVTDQPVSDPYLSWIEGYTPNALLPDAASKLAAADPDSDGITNLMEFVLGGSPVVSSQSILPTQATVGTDLVLSYTRSDESEADTTQVGQWSSDLTNWNNVTPVLVNENGAASDNMTVTVPNSNAVNGKLFLRLNVVKP